MSYCAHFPVQDPNYAGLGLVEDYIVDFVVAVNKGCAIFGLRARVREEGYHVVLVRDLSYGFSGFLVLGRGLGLRDGVEGGDLAGVEARGFTVCGEVYGGG